MDNSSAPLPLLKPTPGFVMLHLLFPSLATSVAAVVSLLTESPYSYAVLLFLASLTIYRFTYLFTIKYDLSGDQIVFRRGVFSRQYDYLEWYRIKDIAIQKPFLLRLVGAMNIELRTSDQSHPILLLKGVSSSHIAHSIHLKVEEARAAKGVYEID